MACIDFLPSEVSPATMRRLKESIDRMDLQVRLACFFPFLSFLPN